MITVYPAATEEVPEPEAIPSEVDGSFRLLPGEYAYSAEAEGYVPVEKLPFTVTTVVEEALTVSVVLEATEDDPQEPPIVLVAAEDELQEPPVEEEDAEDSETEETPPVAFDQSRTVNGVTVTVKAEPGVFPAGAVLSVELVPVYTQVQADAAIEEVRDENVNVAVSYTFDIKVINPETGEEVQPAEGQTVSVSFALAEVADENLETSVYHVTEDEATGELSAEALDVIQEDAVTATVETDGFSLYVVEFTYNNLKYALQGDSSVALSEILAAVGLTGEVTNVTVPNSGLLSASNATGEWIITSLKSFNYASTLKVKIKNGSTTTEYTITVTPDHNVFTVTSSTSGTTTTFTVARSGDTSVAETVRYRTVSLSALEGQNFTAASGTLTFAANETGKTVNVTERTPTDIFQYAAGQTSGYRSYRFEVLDMNGFELASKERSWQVTGVITKAAQGTFDLDDERTGTFYSQSSGPIMITDDGYDSNPWDSFAPFDTQKYLSLPSTTFYEDGTRDYLYAIRAELRMWLEFRAYEFNDGYQYLQVLTDNTSTCDNRSGCSNGDPGNLSLSRYMAGFEIDKGDTYTTYKNFTFPILSVGSGAGASDPWGYGDQFPLSMQKFKSGCRATDGRIILNTNFSTLVLRLNASGSGDDDWAVNDIKAYVTAVDTTAPAVWTQGITLAPGPYNTGNAFYVSVPFTEIVIGHPTLNTSWGEATYIDGSGTNVLTFQGTVPANATSTPFSVTGFSGTLPKDLFENVLGSTVAEKGFTIPANNPLYTIAYDLAGGSVASANPTSYTWDTPDFTLTNPTREGYTFDGWTGTGLARAIETVTIPTHSSGDRTYTANWTPIDYTVTAPGTITGGSVSADKTTGVHIGDTVTLTVTPDAGYALTSLTVNDGDGNPVAVTNNQFTMPASNVTVTVEFQKASATENQAYVQLRWFLPLHRVRQPLQTASISTVIFVTPSRITL